MVASVRKGGHVSQRQMFATSPTARVILRGLRNYLAGQTLGFTRDEALLDELLKCVFCRMRLEREGVASWPGDTVDPSLCAEQYRQVFQTIKQHFSILFAPSEGILLTPIDIARIDRDLGTITLSQTTHDLIGDIYETFIGSNFRGQEGQFFTPKVAVRALVELTAPTPDDTIIDPACGSGSFLLEAAQYSCEGDNHPEQHIFGIEKDSYLARLAQLHLALQYDGAFPISCADSLSWNGDGFGASVTSQMLGQFTLVLMNPPFGSKIVAASTDTSATFDLAHKWRLEKKTGRYIRQIELARNPSPQVLFIERAISLLAPGGQLGMVIPESVLSNPNHRHVVQYILDHMTPVAVIGMPESLFKTSGRGGTHTKVCLVVLRKQSPSENHAIFMAEAKWCGHDSRAREIPKDDMPAILSKYRAFRSGQTITPDTLGFSIPLAEVRNNVLAPRFYTPGTMGMTTVLQSSHNFYRFGELVGKQHISLATGDEVGKLAYGSGDIPFVRTSDISNWEIKVDPKHLVSREVYEKYRNKQDVREGDILLVRDGSYLIGSCAFVSRYDTEIVYQSHIYKIRVAKDAPLDNYLLLAILSSPPVVAQIKSMSFTQDIIDTLGDRILDIVLPVPKSVERQRAISDMVRQVIEDRIEARELARQARSAVVDASFFA